MIKAIAIVLLTLTAASAVADTCPDRIRIDDNGGKAWLGMNAGGFVAGEGQTLAVPCDGRLLTIWFNLVLDGEIWNGASPLGTGDVLTATLRLPAGGIALASANAVIGFDDGTQWIAFDFSDRQVDLLAGEYLFTCHPVGFGQARLAYRQGEDAYLEGVRYVSENGGAGPWTAIDAEFGDLAIKVDLEYPVPADGSSWGEVKSLFQ